MSSVGNKNLVKLSLICVNRETNKSYSQQKEVILNLIKNNTNFNKIGQIWQTLERGGIPWNIFQFFKIFGFIFGFYS